MVFVGTILGGVGETLLNEPYISYVAEEKRPEIVLDIGPTQQRINITVFPIFKNWGLKPGHIENAEFSHRELHLYPEEVLLDYCNKAPISLTSCPYEALRPSGLSSFRYGRAHRERLPVRPSCGCCCC